MSIIVNSLPDYVKQDRLPLIHKAVLGAKTAKLINRQSGVKGSAALNLVGVTPAIKAAGCSFNANGDATLSQRNIVTKYAQVQMSFCEKSLIGKWAEYQVRLVAGEKELPFEQDFTEAIAAEIADAVEAAIWQGESTLGMTGLLDTIANDGGVDANIAGGSSAFDAVKAMYMAIAPAVLKKGAAIYVGMDLFRELSMDLMEKNLFHYASDAAEEMVFPGTNVKVIAVPGLNGTNKLVAANPDNLFYGYDVEDAEDVFDIWYSKDNQEFRLNVEWNMGVQVAYPNEVVYGTKA